MFAGGEDKATWPRYGKVRFVDLAGSERLRNSHSTGNMLRETSSINRSLFTLGKVQLLLLPQAGRRCC